MRYALLIYTPEPTEQAPQDEMAAELELYDAFGRHLRERNAMLGGEALDSTATATTVRVVDGKTITTDGPFAETKESLGGFYLIEAADLDEAIAYAAMIPGARHGCIEVRPVWDYGVSSGTETTAGSGAAN
ncbi:MAG TPA: YciI family protein [Candidatus Limnocylindrales bacterium]|nr:YciI family protein [Candidatus Limnocylindrales bacterium]